MPYGLPSATVCVESVQAALVDEPGRSVFVPYQAHLEILHRGADQDGWLGEIICRYKEQAVAVPPRCLRL
jgi:hypothetical protein